MLSLTIATIVLLALTSVSYAGECRNIPTKKDFDVTKYVGLWYEAYRSNVIFEIGSKCVNATYTPNSDGTVGVWNQAINFFGKYTSIRGSARVKDSMEPAALEVIFDNPNQKGDYNVLATDYDTYSLVYACRNIPIIGKWEFIWFLSRTKTLEPSVVNELKGILSNYGVKTSSLKPTSQDC
ncbi:unnamed protein product [Rotaria sp. Silwood1]|nr:unnamed protein product [Rotaria sp. Silwood1]CAF3494863.1 unnamed protein product [Rotaria sp. Silwood1]CAF3550136.1 unnamed protein product [Rotaria sp. Silwood1]CAF3567967.1 unnamed protein product [Rotaria sp. Silwood1]